MLTKARHVIKTNRRRAFPFFIGAITILVPIFYLTLTKSQTAKAAWFDDEYVHRQKISFVHNAEISNRSVTFSLDTTEIIAAGLMQSDCDDTRFTDSTGKQLQYDLTGTCNNAATTYEILVENVISGTNILFVYYHSPNATNSESNSTGWTALTPSGGDPSITTRTSEETTEGPVAYWKFEEGLDDTCSGDTNDACDSGSGKNDGAFGATTAAPTWQSEENCVSGKCLKFDGSNDVVTVSNASSIDFDIGLKSGVTISAWVKANSDGENNLGQVYSKGTNTFLRIVGERTDGLADLEASLDLATTNATVSLTNSVKLNQWHYITVGYTDDDDDEITVYIDGINVGTSTNGAGSPASDTNNLLLGGDTAANFHGFLDNFKIYPYERSAAQVRSDFASRFSTKGVSSHLGPASDSFISNGLVGYWPLDEYSVGSGQVDRMDVSGNNNTLTDSSTTPSSSAGKFGQSASFTASNTEYLYRNDNTNLSMGDIDFTLSAWVQITDKSADRAIISKWRTTSSNMEYYLYYDNSSDRFVFSVSSNGSSENSVVANSLGSPSTTTRYLVSGWHDATKDEIGIKINDLEPDTAAYSGGVADKASIFAIGARQTSSPGRTDYWEGIIDEARVYKRVLSNSELHMLYKWLPGPVFYAPLNESSGTTSVSDISGNVNTGAIQGSITDTSWVSGKFGSALELDGSDDSITVNNSSSLYIIGGVTVSAWVKFLDNGEDYIISKSQDGNNKSFDLSTNAGSLGPTVEFRTAGTGSCNTWVTSGDSSELNLGEWYFISGVYLPSNAIQVYVNGKLENSNSTSIPASQCQNSSALEIGDQQSFNGNLRGTVDEVKIYNYARTAGQIIEDMNGGHPLGGSPIGSQAGYWRFDEGFGDSANDSSNNGVIGDLGDSDTTCLTAGADCPTWTNDGKVNGALDFDGNDLVELDQYPYTHPELNATERLTITAWIRSDTSGTDDARIFGIYGLGQTQYALDISSGVLNLQLNSSTVATGTTNLNSSGTTWYHVAATWDKDINGGEAIIYVNGLAEDTGFEIDALPDWWQPIRIGIDTDGNFGFDGLIDEVKFYSAALTPEQIQIDMNANSSAAFSTLGEAEEASLADGEGASPIGYWDFNENTGTSTVYDKSGNGLNASMSNFTNSSWVPGAPGKSSALSFNGSTNILTVSDSSSLDIASSFTLEAWIYPKSIAGPGSYSTILTREDSVTSNSNYYLELNSDDEINCGFYSSGYQEHSTSNSPVSLNEWQHISCVFDTSANTIKIFHNGVLQASDAETSNLVTNNSPLTIGEAPIGNVQQFDGYLDELKIYNYARSNAQVAYDYNRGAPIGWWQLDECQGAIAYDASGRGNNGTITIGGSGTNTSVGTCSSGTSTEAWNNGTSGKFNASLDFDGTNDYITIDNGDTQFDHGTADFTHMVWIKTTQDCTGNKVYLGQRQSSRPNIWIGCAQSGGIGVAAADTDSSLTTISNFSGVTQINDGQWHHVALVKSGHSSATVTLYVDGVADVSITPSFSGVFDFTDNSLSIGRFITSYYADAQIDDVRIYNYALSETQIKKLMNNNAGVRFGPNTGSP